MAHYRIGAEKLEFIVREGEKNRLKLKWQERGGPQVVQPTRQGFGTALLKAVFPDARFDYATEGVNCEIDVLLKTGEPGAGDLLVSQMSPKDLYVRY